MSITILQYRENQYEISDTVFVGNEAWSGGAVYAIYLEIEDMWEPALFFNDAVILPSLWINNTRLDRNSARVGGALTLSSVRAFFTNVTMESNSASEAAGACELSEGTVALVVNGTFNRNEAATGGAIAIGERLMLHCIRCEITRNTASGVGGGVVALFLLRQPHGFQCDSCSIMHNRAELGGAINLCYMCLTGML